MSQLELAEATTASDSVFRLVVDSRVVLDIHTDHSLMVR